MQEICNNDRRGPPARIIHERLRPSRGSRGFRGRQPPPAYVCPPDTSSDLLCDGKVRRGTFWSPVPPRTVAVVGLPRPDGKSLAGTRCMSASDHPIAIDSSSLNDMTVFRPGVRGLSVLDKRHTPAQETLLLLLPAEAFGLRAFALFPAAGRLAPPARRAEGRSSETTSARMILPSVMT